MLAAAFLINALLAGAALAIPSPRERVDKRVARRFAHLSSPRIASELSGTGSVAASNATGPLYSQNWSGSVLVANNNTFKSVTATFTIPVPREPSGGTGFHAGSAWVGIDGDTCGSAILQTGVDFVTHGNRTSFDAWYEWFPAPSTDFKHISLAAGDVIRTTVVATSLTSGSAVLENLSTGQTVSHTFSNQPSLCQANAEWIVEDFGEGTLEDPQFVPFAGFDTVTFAEAVAGTADGKMSPADGTIIFLKQNGTVLTTASANDTSVTVTYTGP